ncbi:hypothetical protein E2562_004928 [Oryza meyeriana var. granulata]|uniref:SS18 N-terminal domain-containing protein n=1 Tax=Oryza meyeriana var. granulata TaxID=110450 RepID=A0A6G1C394_9ORYZ|nr:hypothetical protein E2562_004928 [Oryza meyeriana var. granulata]
MQQQMAMPAGAAAAAVPPAAGITTEQIQKYLDENKQLILAILENQNLGKLAECTKLSFKRISCIWLPLRMPNHLRIPEVDLSLVRRQVLGITCPKYQCSLQEPP